MKKHFLFLSVLMTMFMGMLSLEANAQISYTAISGTSGYANEGYANLFDGSTNTKWCCAFSSSNGVEVVFQTSQAIHVDGYVITTANDSKDNNGARNPKSWMLIASADNVNWDTIHAVTDDQTIQAVNYTAYTFRLPAVTAATYKYFRWKITAIHSYTTFQASEFELLLSCDHSTGMTRHPATPATCLSPAYGEYWTCNVCGRMFTDSAATHALLSLDSIVTAPIGGHNYVDGVCTVCGHHEHAAWDVNLLTNCKPTTATGFSGWTASSSWMIVDTCFATNTTSTTQTLSQTVDLSKMGFADGEANGKQVWVSVDVAAPSGNYNGACFLRLTFIGTNGSTITYNTFWDKTYYKTELQKQTRAWTYTIPNGTAKITYELRGRSQNSTQPLTYTDMTLKVLQTAPTSYNISSVSDPNAVSASFNRNSAPAGHTIFAYYSTFDNHTPGGIRTSTDVTWLEPNCFVMPASDVTVTAYANRTTKYKITTVSCEGFTITSPKDSTYAGDTIRLNRVKADGYDCFTIKANNSSAKFINDSTFLMPSDNVTLTASAEPAAKRQAVMPQAEGVTYSFADGTYCFVPVDSATRAACVPGLMSNNNGLVSSVAQSTISFFLPRRMLFSYSYFVSSERNCDKLAIFIDEDTRVDYVSGTSFTPCNDTVVLAAGAHTLRLLYSKDNSSDYGLDRGFIYNMKLVGDTLYSLTATSAAHLTLTASAAQARECDTITLATSRQEGYLVDSFATSVPVVWVAANRFIMPASAVTVTLVEKAVTKHPISVAATDHVTISVAAEAYPGDTVRFTRSTDHGYYCNVINTTPNTIQFVAPDAFVMPDTAVTIIPFVQEYPRYGISCGSAANATISTNVTSAYEGDTVLFHYTVADGYELIGIGEVAYYLNWLSDTCFIMPGANINFKPVVVKDRRSVFSLEEGITVELGSNSAPWTLNEKYDEYKPGLVSGADEGNSSTLYLTISSENDFKLSFDYYVSSEQGCDMFSISSSFYGSIDSWSGTGNDPRYFRENLPAGEHFFTFDYYKDGSVDTGLDRAFIYNVRAVNARAVTVNLGDHVNLIDAPTVAFPGDVVYIEYEAEDGYACLAPVAEGVQWLSPYSFKMPSADVEINLTAASKTVHNITITPVEHITISLDTLRGYPGDTITFSAEVDSLYRYERRMTPVVQWLNFNQFLMPNEDLNVSAFVEPIPSAVLAFKGEPYIHTIAIRDNDTLSAGDLVYDGDMLDLEFTSEALYLYVTSMSDVYVSVKTDTFYISPVRSWSVNTPRVKTVCLDSTTCQLTFSPGFFTGYDLVIATEQVKDYNRLETMKGRRHLTDSTYTAVGLITGNTYYAYVRVNDSIVGESSWRETSFVTSNSQSGDNCMLHFEMADDYCDGWNGSYIVVYVDGQFVDEVAPNSNNCTDFYDLAIDGEEVQIIWVGSDGNYNEECACSVTNAAGEVLFSFGFNEAVGSNYDLYNGYPCSSSCASLDSLVVVNDSDDITIAWGSADAVSYNYVLSQNSKMTGDQLDSLATSTTTTGYNFQAEPAKGYLFYYQLVCAEGEATAWRSVEAFSDSLVNLNDSATVASVVWTPLALDTIVEGNVLEASYLANLGSSSAKFVQFFTFALEDSTDVMMIYESASHNGSMVLFDDSLNYIDEFQAATMTLDSGAYRLCVIEDNCKINYRLTLQEAGSIVPVDTIRAVPYLSDTIAMADAGMIAESGFYAYEKDFAIILPDTTEVLFAIRSIVDDDAASFNYGMSLSDSTSSVNGGNSFSYRLLPGYQYTLRILTDDPTTNYQVSLKSANGPIAYTDILTDTLYTTSISTSDGPIKISGSYRAGKLYRFTLDEPATISSVFLKSVNNSSVGCMIMRDSVGSGIIYSTNYDATPATTSFRQSLSAGTYFVALYTYMSSADITFGIRTAATYSDIAFAPADTIQVGQLDTIEAGLNHGYSTEWWSGDYVAAKIWLEEDQTYYIFGEHAGYENLYVGCMVLKEDVSSPMCTSSTSYDNRGITYYFEPEQSGYYTVVINTGAQGQGSSSYNYNYTRDEYSYDVILRVDTAIPFLDYVAQVDTLDSLPYRADFDMLSMPLVGWNGYYSFQTPHSQRTSYDGKGHLTYAVHAVVQPGDTLFAEIASTENVVLYFYPFENSSYSYGHSPEVYDEVVYGAEQGFFVNRLTTAQTITVVVSLDEVDFYGDPIPSTLRLSTSAAALEPVVVTADASEEVLYFDEASVVAALDTLSALSIFMLDSTGATIAELTNDIRWWTVDFAAGKAYYELAESDLPAGYNFGSEDPYFVTVDLVVRQFVYAAANKESVTITDKSEAAVREVLAAEVSITVSDATGLLVQTFDSESACWSAWTVDLATMKASITLTDAMLAPEYRFEGGEAVVTIDINGIFTAVENISTDTTTAGAIKRIENDHIVIETANGRVFDATGRLIR